MWKTVGASVQGTSHVKNTTPCQDFSAYRHIIAGQHSATLIAISDGAGSAKLSHEGSRFVVTNWLEAAETFLNDIAEVDQKLLAEIADFTRANLADYVASKEGEVGDYACTLLAAILFESRTLFFQVGDGAWVYRTDEGYGCATWPFQGEFAGETVFLTSKTAPEHYQIASVEKVDSVAGFTDGLERLALKMATKEASPLFFDSMFKSLAASEAKEIEANLRTFLKSDRLNERTDDDKTLVLATKVTGDDGL